MTYQERWPALPLDEWKDCYTTLHMWMQIIGKIRMKLSPPLNHWWHSALYVTDHGLATGPLFYGDRSFGMELDFIEHELRIRTSTDERRAMSLAPRSVAVFYRELMDLLGTLGIQVKIDLMPKEVPNPIPCDVDDVHDRYLPEYANRHWRILAQVDRVLKIYRGEFLGKSSPVHFFWGSFDLAVSRFSGRRAPARPDADHITQVGYSHEVMSVGFWPGSGNIEGPAFYAYCAPEPPGFSTARIRPGHAFYNPPTKGFVLMYDEVRKSSDPDAMILEFCRSAYEAAARLGGWDRFSLEMPELKPVAAPGKAA